MNFKTQEPWRTCNLDSMPRNETGQHTKFRTIVPRSTAAVMTTSAPELAMLAAVGAPEPWRRRRSTRGSAMVAMGSDARASEFGSESSGWTAAGATVVGLQRDPRK